jgi:sugar phosphate isomerase/epimerase
MGAVVEAFASRGLRAGGWGAGVSLTASAPEFSAGLAELPRRAAIGAALGARAAIVVVPNRSDLEPERALDALGERLAQLARALTPFGVALSLEFIGPDLWPDRPHRLPDGIPGVLDLIDRVGQPNIGILFDTYHFHCGSSRLEDIRCAAGRINHVHLNDAPPGDPSEFDDWMRRLPGDGVLDLRSIARELAAAGYEGPAGVEVFNQDLRSLDAVEAARTVAASCRRVFGSL